MVFGNCGETSATGVAFTRNPSTGENALYGEFLVNAQGEDVIAGICMPGPLGAVEVIPLADDPFGLEAVGQLVQIDCLVLERPPQALDEDVVHAAIAISQRPAMGEP